MNKKKIYKKPKIKIHGDLVSITKAIQDVPPYDGLDPAYPDS